MNDAAAALSIFSQLAVALTGFAGLLTAFRTRGTWSPVEIAGLHILLLTSVGAMAFSVAPLPALLAGTPEAQVWSLASLALGLFLLLMTAGGLRMVLAQKLRSRRPLIFWLLVTALGATAAAEFAAAADLFDWRGPATYSIGVIALLAVATLQFLLQIFSTLSEAPPKE